tara:strand:+ start:30497 stop:31516 length:1020 start_codon:yes stop_codon:yes gene_type:complete
MVLLIGNFLSRHGFNPTAIEDLEFILLQKYNVKVSSKRKNRIFRLIDMVASILYYHKSCRIAIIDVFATQAILFSFIIIIILRVLQKPYVPVLRGGSLPELYKKNPFVIKFILDNAACIISPSNFLKIFFKKYDSKIKIIPNYIHLNKYTFKPRSGFKPRLLWVRSIHGIYNPKMAIYVLSKIVETYSDAELYMVGPIKDDEIMNELTILIQKFNLVNNIHFYGQLSKEEWIKLSEDCDIFINTTNYDNHPVSVIEAMALGLPVISTNVGGIPYLLEDNRTALFVEKNNYKNMSAKIFSITQNKIDTKKIIFSARELVEKFDVEKIKHEWFDLIDKVNA